MDLLDELALLSWVPPHLIPELVEEHVEEIAALQPLDARLMDRMPSIDAREFALPFRINQGPVEDSEPYVDAPEDTRHWDDFAGLEYAGVRDHYEWSLVEPEEDLEDEMTAEAYASTVEADEIMSAEADTDITAEADTEITGEADEITVDNKAPPSLAATNPLDIMTTHNILLQEISPGAPLIATIGIQDVDSTSLAFGPTLESR